MMHEAMLYDSLEKGKVRCRLCSHHCRIDEGALGFCGVRQNRGGKLFTRVYGEVIAAGVDPIEKKPLYHFLPGTLSFSIATMGCNFHCGFCQNWQISQITADADEGLRSRPLAPDEVVRQARNYECRSIAYTYTEPTIFFEYAYDTGRLAAEQGLSNIFVTNGYMTEEALRTIQPYLHACNVDLKSFRDDFYRRVCKARLGPVLDSIRLIKDLGMWLEVTTLVIPDENDSEEELSDIAGFIAEVDEGIPWHLSRFHPDYEWSDSSPTSLETLHRAYELGKEKGLRYVYLGNVPGESRDVCCPACSEAVVLRPGGSKATLRVTGEGRCPRCGELIPGVWQQPDGGDVGSETT